MTVCQADLVGEGAEQGVEADQILERLVVGGVVDGDDPHVLALVEDAKQVAADAAETHQSDASKRHGCTPCVRGLWSASPPGPTSFTRLIPPLLPGMR